jgi:predicted kinase
MTAHTPVEQNSESRYLVHLVCGSTGAGKTTFAAALAEATGAVTFSIDEWMTNLFWQDSPQPVVSTWTLSRVERCYVQIWTTAARVVAAGVPAILDLGLSTAADRKRFITPDLERGYPIRLHFLDVPADVRWNRVRLRNASKGDGYHLEITRDMFDFVESIFEAPTEEEMRIRNGQSISPSSPA